MSHKTPPTVAEASSCRIHVELRTRARVHYKTVRRSFNVIIIIIILTEQKYYAHEAPPCCLSSVCSTITLWPETERVEQRRDGRGKKRQKGSMKKKKKNEK